MYYELIIKIVIFVVFVMTAVSFFAIFTKYQNVNYLGRRIAREIELEGAISNDVRNTLFNRLKAELGLDSATLTVVNAKYFGASDKIQLRDSFTIRVSYRYRFQIFDPAFLPPVVIPFDMTATYSGISEVYWK